MDYHFDAENRLHTREALKSFYLQKELNPGFWLWKMFKNPPVHTKTFFSVRDIPIWGNFVSFDMILIHLCQ